MKEGYELILLILLKCKLWKLFGNYLTGYVGLVVLVINGNR